MEDVLTQSIHGLGQSFAMLGAMLPYLFVLGVFIVFLFVIAKRKELARYIPILRDYKYRAVILSLRGGEYLPEMVVPAAIITEDDGSRWMHLKKINKQIQRIDNRYISRENYFVLFTRDYEEFFPIECVRSQINNQLALLPVLTDEEKQHYSNTIKRLRLKYANPSFFEKYQSIISVMLLGALAIGVIAVNNSTVADAQVKTAASAQQIATSLNEMTDTLIAGGILHTPPNPEPPPSNPQEPPPG